MNALDRWKTAPARTRALGAAAVAAISFALVYHVLVSPLRSSAAASRAQIAEIDKRLAAVAAKDSKGNAYNALLHKSVGPLSAAPVVDALTDIAHENGISRVRFKTDVLKPLDRRGKGTGSQTTLVRMPVRIDLETEARTFAAFLDSLEALPFPLAVEKFQMRPNPKPGGAFIIMLGPEVYGTGE